MVKNWLESKWCYIRQHSVVLRFFLGMLHSRGLVEWTLLELHSSHARCECHCISLLEDPKLEVRRSLFSQYASKLSWPVRFWPAEDGRSQALTDFPPWIAPGAIRPSSDELLQPGEVGLLMSTRALYQHALESDLDYLIVFEDDAILFSPPVISLPVDFDIVFLNNRFHGDLGGEVRAGCGTDTYIISRSGLKKMMVLLEGANQPIDLLMLMYTESFVRQNHFLCKERDASKPLLRCFHSGPVTVNAGFFETTIKKA